MREESNGYTPICLAWFNSIHALKAFLKGLVGLGMVARACDPSTQAVEAEGFEFEASLGHEFLEVKGGADHCPLSIIAIPVFIRAVVTPWRTDPTFPHRRKGEHGAPIGGLIMFTCTPMPALRTSALIPMSPCSLERS